jgi:hypothetical protein
VENASLIQTTIIPRATRWANSSEAAFEADKTTLIHFMRTNNDSGLRDKVHMDGQEIDPHPSAKILGLLWTNSSDSTNTLQEPPKEESKQHWLSKESEG